MLQLYTAVQKGYFQHLYLTYNISHIVYRVNLQHNNIFALPAAPTYCCYTTLGKNRMHILTLATKITRLHKILQSIQFAQTVAAHLSPNITARVQLASFVHPHRPELS